MAKKVQKGINFIKKNGTTIGLSILGIGAIGFGFSFLDSLFKSDREKKKETEKEIDRSNKIATKYHKLGITQKRINEIKDIFINIAEALKFLKPWYTIDDETTAIEHLKKIKGQIEYELLKEITREETGIELGGKLKKELSTSEINLFDFKIK